MRRLIPLLLLGVLLPAPVARAHDSPEHSIEDLTAHMQQEGESVPLLLHRASQYRVLGQPQRAIADLLRVLQLEPNQQGALVELSRIHLALGKPDLSLQWIQRAIDATKSDAAKSSDKHQSHLYAARGDAYNAKADYAKALADYNRAIAADAMQVDWYLNRSRLHELLNRPAERIKGLSKGYESTQSAVLYNEWVEALIDGGQAAQALRAIQPRLEAARLKSSWRIRRARARLALNNKREYSRAIQSDLQMAIAEITARLSPSRPDVDLLLDRAQAHLLSGNGEAARQDVALAATHGASARQLEKWQRHAKRYAKENRN